MSTATPRHQRPGRLDRFLFGAPYYPEHWTPAERAEDPNRMAAAGVNVVRMAEFAWDRMEPRPGQYDFDLFDETIVRLGAQGIDTILCTPTATPPRWMTMAHPEWHRVDADGHAMHHGSRQHCCTTNPGFRAASAAITRAMARHFAANPHVIGWQTDNELNCHFSACYCPACETAFRDWLRAKYGAIDALNAAWGTAFWALTFGDFAEIPLPNARRPAHANPSQQLDYARFLSDAVCAFQRGQVEVLRAEQPRWWVMHNGLFAKIDYWRFAEDLDFLGVDVYPGFSGRQPEAHVWASLLNQRCRAASGSYIIPEQQGGAGGQEPYLHETPPPGQMRLWAWQGVAHGADGILHFRWRTCRFGAEIYWNGILDHDNIPRRRYEEFSREGAEFARLGQRLLGTVQDVRAAVLIQQDQDEAHQTMSLGLPSPRQQAEVLCGALLARHLPAGLVCAEDSFDGLRVLFLPSFPLMEAALARKLEAFVEGGGILVATARSATRDRHNQVIDQTPPGLLSGVFGVTVEEFGKLAHSRLDFGAGGGDLAPAGAAYEILSLRDAEALAAWTAPADAGPHAAPGRPAIARRRLGDGAAVYIGTYASPANVSALLDLALQGSGLERIGIAEPCVEITRRRAKDREFVFLLNHYATARQVTGLPAGLELLSGATCAGALELPPFGVAVVEESAGAKGAL